MKVLSSLHYFQMLEGVFSVSFHCYIFFFVCICLLRRILEKLSNTIKPCWFTLSWLHMAQDSALQSHSEGKTSLHTLRRICSIWIDNHSAVASSCCLMQSLNLMQIPKGITKSSKCLSWWNMWELFRRLERVWGSTLPVPYSWQCPWITTSILVFSWAWLLSS